MEQLSIFDILNEFEENQANWENVLDNHERCTVLAYIPDDALSPLEIPYRSGSKEYEYHKEIWGDYVTAIFHYLGPGDVWCQACNMLQEYRVEKKPCPMEISRSLRFKERTYFKPAHVLKYL